MLKFTRHYEKSIEKENITFGDLFDFLEKNPHIKDQLIVVEDTGKDNKFAITDIRSMLRESADAGDPVLNFPSEQLILAFDGSY